MIRPMIIPIWESKKNHIISPLINQFKAIECLNLYVTFFFLSSLQLNYHSSLSHSFILNAQYDKVASCIFCSPKMRKSDFKTEIISFNPIWNTEWYFKFYDSNKYQDCYYTFINYIHVPLIVWVTSFVFLFLLLQFQFRF